ncbi:MAG: cation transporter [Schaedlerella sp.]|nr:cation transporter [Schaedlerella sp.]
MENIIIIIILLVLVFIGLRSALKHFKGEGGCCGGGAPVPKQNKKLKNVISKKVVVIEGMTCEHCKNWVEKSINSIDGAAAKVNLQKKEAVVSLEKHIDDETICEAVEKAGYSITEIRKIV